MSDSFLVPPKSPPELNIPASKNTVKVSCIDTTGRFRLPISAFLQPEYVGHDNLCGPSFSFLIEHPSSKPILFDLGIRKDWEKLPSYEKFVKLKWYINVEKDTATILKENNVDVDGGAIETIIWSHHHWDHVGNASTFPGSTELVVGPGFKDAHLPGYPKNKDSTLLDSDFDGRSVREASFDDQGGLKIGRFRALDYFGDGSFYLLDTPGHAVGHICGLARTSSSPDSFVFMGGDAAHHGGEFRPTEYLPLPKELKPSPMKRKQPVCPGHLLLDLHPYEQADKPFYYVTASFANDKKVADWTIDGLGEFDAHENVLMLMAHDDAIVNPGQIDFYPKTLNDWYEKGLGQKLKWLFLRDFDEALEEKQNGGKPFKWGQYP
ncbi:putative metallo-beta-lactamase, ribonuclease Z/Hydroxyacylglutathione hydrolase [Septoria linicola]|nr:putative metallo-beta-lactamase, ribonuclease Z/Hydroxyacylglutathione hydrolase [Septoria linicola]